MHVCHGVGKAEWTSKPHLACVMCLSFVARKGLRQSLSAGLTDKAAGCPLVCCWGLLWLRMCLSAGTEEVHGGG